MNGSAVVFGRNTTGMPARDPARGGIGFAAAIFILAAAFLIIFAPGLAGAVSVKPGDAAPDFTVRTLGGDEVSLRDYAGRVVLVVFWSSWCSRCREEFDFLRAMQERHPGLAILALNAETDQPTPDDLARMREAVKTWGMPAAVAVDEGLRVWSRYQVNALPTSVIVGVDGTVLFAEANFFFASPEAIEAALETAFAGVPGELCRKELCLLADLPAAP